MFFYRPHDLTPEQIARHEVAHTAARLSQGLSVKAVDIIGNHEYGGWVLIDRPANPDPDYLTREAVDIMAAWIEGSNDMEEVPEWPLDSRPVTSKDEQDLAHIVNELGWNALDYSELKLKAFRLMETDTYRMIFDGLLGMCDYTPRLSEHQIDALRLAVVKQLKSED